MSLDYTSVTPTNTYGGGEMYHDGSFLLSQCQHLLVNGDVILVNMMFNSNLRAIENNTGSFKCDIGQAGFQDSDFEMAAGMCLYESDQILVTDLNANKIMAFNAGDLSFRAVLLEGFTFDKANSICTDSFNNIYIGEIGENPVKVRCFDANLQEKFTISEAGGSLLTGANYLSYDNVRQRLLVTDSDANSVHCYDDQGSFQFSITSSGADGSDDLVSPQGTCVDRMGNILVCDSGNSQVKVFDQEGSFVSMLGSEDMFSSPMDICVNNDNEVFVLDGNIFMGWSRVQKFVY